jgi:hypothetical protein
MYEHTDLQGNRYQYDERSADFWAEAFVPVRKTDRIERGVLLTIQGNVARQSADRWAVRSERDQATTYNVTAEACECPDATKGRTICKHQWASAGQVAAIVIIAIRKARTVSQARRILEPAAAQLAGLPIGYRRTIAAEYARAVRRISRHPITRRREAA